MARMRKSRIKDEQGASVPKKKQNVKKKRGRGRPRKTEARKPKRGYFEGLDSDTEEEEMWVEQASQAAEEEDEEEEEEYNDTSSEHSTRRKRRRRKTSSDADSSDKRMESELEKQIRLAIDRERVRLRRANETEDERRKRLDADRERSRVRRQNETPEQRAIRLTMDRERNRLRRLNMSEAERQAALIADKEAHRLRRENETEIERKKRLAENKARIKMRRLTMTPEERKADRLARSAQIRNARALLTLGEMERLYRLALVRERNRLKKIKLSPEERVEKIDGSKESAYAQRKNETASQYQERLVKLRREWIKFVLLKKFHDVVNVPDDGSMETSIITDDIKSDEESLNKEYVMSVLEKIRERKVYDEKELKYFITLSDDMKAKLKSAIEKLQLEKATSIVKEMLTEGLSLDMSLSETEDSMEVSAPGPASVFPNSVYNNEPSEDEDSHDILLDEISGALILPAHMRSNEDDNLVAQQVEEEEEVQHNIEMQNHDMLKCPPMMTNMENVYTMTKPHENERIVVTPDQVDCKPIPGFSPIVTNPTTIGPTPPNSASPVIISLSTPNHISPHINTSSSSNIILHSTSSPITNMASHVVTTTPSHSPIPSNMAGHTNNIILRNPTINDRMGMPKSSIQHPIMPPQFPISHINRHLPPPPHMNPGLNPCMQNRLTPVPQSSMEGHLPYGYECSVVDQMRATLNASIHLSDSSATMDDHMLAQENRMTYLKDHSGNNYTNLGEPHYSNHC